MLYVHEMINAEQLFWISGKKKDFRGLDMIITPYPMHQTRMRSATDLRLFNNRPLYISNMLRKF